MCPIKQAILYTYRYCCHQRWLQNTDIPFAALLNFTGLEKNEQIRIYLKQIRIYLYIHLISLVSDENEILAYFDFDVDSLPWPQILM